MEPPELPPELAELGDTTEYEEPVAERADAAEYEETVGEPGVLARLRHDYALQALLILTLLVNFALIGFLILRYESLPDPLPLHFDASGLPDRIDAKSGILALPVIGLVVYGLNAVLGVFAYRRERAATVLLVIAAMVVQLLMWLATINVAGGLY
jgi:hypothetical protein